MDYTDYYELIASAMVLAQLFFYGRKSLLGPILGIIATAMWIGIGISHGIFSLWALNVCLLIQSVVNYLRWYWEKYPPLEEERWQVYRNSDLFGGGSDSDGTGRGWY